MFEINTNRVSALIKVFIGGSRHISRLNKIIRERLNNIISNKYQVLLGDANGADKSVQEFFYEMHYKSVLVYCSGDYCRNNVGSWDVINVTVPTSTHGNRFYMVKDARMAEAADYGFMLWDGKSPGTLNNVFNLLIHKKKALLYYSPEKCLLTISKLEDIDLLLAKWEPNDLLRFEKRFISANLKKR